MIIPIGIFHRPIPIKYFFCFPGKVVCDRYLCEMKILSEKYPSFLTGNG